MAFQLAREDTPAAAVHYTAYSYSSDPNLCILIYNITLPARVVDDPDARLAHLERANAWITDDYGDVDVVYQVTGSYTLRHANGSTQEWTGSFYTHARDNPSQIQGFRRFDRDDFTQSSFELLNHAEAILRQNGEDSSWSFESLISVIFNVQGKIRKDSDVVRIRAIRFNSRFQHKFNLF